MGGRLLAFNYRTIYMPEDQRRELHQKFIVEHYLRQFNEETIEPRNQRNCGEPCPAVCKKSKDHYKKDYEPYQTLGPLCGVFDQRAAERLNHHADRYGFDAISVGGVLAWLMECLDRRQLTPGELGVQQMPVFSPDGFSLETDSRTNAELGVELLDSIIHRRGIVNLEDGARKFARHLAHDKGKQVLDPFVYVAFARKGWMVPNQYWVPGVLSPMAMMGKYYIYYGNDFVPPRTLGRINAERFRGELIMDNMGLCRFHRLWAEEMLPEVIGELYDKKDAYLKSLSVTASRINSRNSSVFWESRAQRRLRSYLSDPAARRGRHQPSRAGRMDCRVRERQTAGRLCFLVRNAQRHPRIAARVLKPWPHVRRRSRDRIDAADPPVTGHAVPQGIAGSGPASCYALDRRERVFLASRAANHFFRDVWLSPDG